MAGKKPRDWEKVTVYLSISTALSFIFFMIADMKERTRALEVEMVNIKNIL